jgi:RHS repeat-associated protein
MRTLEGAPRNAVFVTWEKGRENEAHGQYYYRARYYEPSIGRFVSQDPIGFAGGINEYAYAEDNPARFKDPIGNVVIDPNGTGVGGIKPFPDGSVADLVLALQRARQLARKNPKCNCYFKTIGMGLTLTELLDSPSIFVYYHPDPDPYASDLGKGTTLAWTDPRNDGIYFFPEGTNDSVEGITQTLIHELAHADMLNPPGNVDQEPAAQEAEFKCGFHIRIRQSITVTAK